MSKGKTSTTSSTAIDPQQLRMYQGLYDTARVVADQPYTPYTGARVAGFNKDQLQGFDATRNMFGQSMGYDPRQGLNILANQSAPTVSPFTGKATQLQPAAMQQASNIAPVDLYSGASVNRGAIRNLTPQTFLNTNLQSYQNPYTQQVIDTTLADLDRARKMAVGRDQDQAIGAGAFGGSRSGILEAETNRAFADQAARTAAGLRQGGFDRATSLAGQDIGRQFDADKYMSGVDSNVAMQNATFGQQAGLARQGLLGDVAQNQAQLDARRFGADQSASNQFGLQQGSYNNAMNMANMDARNRAAFMRPQLEMQNRAFQSGLFGNQLADQYSNLGLLANIGRQQQGLQQAGLDQAYNQFLDARGYGGQQIGLLSSALGLMPQQVSTTQTGQKKTGLGDVLGSAAQLAGSFASGGFFN